MYMDNQALYKIIAKKWLNSLSTKEERLLEGWLSQSPHNQELYEKLLFFIRQEGDQSPYAREHDIKHLIDIFWEKEKLHIEPGPKSPVRILRLNLYRAAAIFILLLSLPAIYFIGRITHKSSGRIAMARMKDSSGVTPGSDKAVLFLSNGRQIDLVDNDSSDLKELDGTSIDNTNGQLRYSGNDQSEAVLFNTVKVPRGGKYQLVLQDGTTVYLNAASSLRFPTHFSGGQRKVYISGEAFFNVKPKYRNKVKIPFVVDVAGREEIEVVGTQFNVHSYDDENVDMTTLIQGCVKIKGNGSALQLKPGEQALSKRNVKMRLIEHADVDKAVAWKSDIFQFKNDNLQIIMQQISRWYDVDVAYKSVDESVTYSGLISRNVPLANVLEMLKLSGVEFELNNKTVTVIKNIKQGD